MKTKADSVPDINALIGSVVDRGASLIFDWLAEPPGTRTREIYELMSQPIGPTRDISQTNMQSAQQFLAPMGVLTRSLHCFYGSMRPEDREVFRESYMLQFWILQKVFYEVPLIAMPLQGVVLPWVKAATSDDWPSQPGDLDPFPRYIPPFVQFGIRLRGNPVSLPGGLKFLCCFNVYMDRAVQ